MLGRQDVAAGDQAVDGLEDLHVVRGDQVEKAGGQEQPVRPPVPQLRADLLDRKPLPAHDRDLGARTQRGPDLEDRGVERGGRELGDDIAWRDRQLRVLQ